MFGSFQASIEPHIVMFFILDGSHGKYISTGKYIQGITRRAFSSDFDYFAMFNINWDAPKNHLPRFTRRITLIP